MAPGGTVAARLAELDEVELEVEKLVAGGDGLGRIEGIPIFVPRSAPGDRLRVRLVERHPDYARGEIVALLAAGAGRRAPPCPYFERCGGCDLQHLEDDVQLRLKAEAVRETLLRLGRLAMPPRVTVIPGAPWGYRLRCQLQVAETPRGVEVGYFERRSHRLVAVERCPILLPELERQLPELPALLGGRRPRRLDLAVGDGGRLTSAPVVEGIPHGEVRLRLGAYDYAYDARTFFQAHRGLLPQLVEQAVGPWEGETACDLYAGVGLFSLPLAARYGGVMAVESDRVAARYARLNARRHRLANVEVVARSVETWADELPGGTSRVLVDPPRAGLPRRLRQALLRRPPARLTYVSCHAATLARDLRQLTAGFSVESLALLDMFPQTGHMEVVAQLVAAKEEAG